MNVPPGFRMVTIRARVRRTDNAFQITECLSGEECQTEGFLVSATGQNLSNLMFAAGRNLPVEVIGLVGANEPPGAPSVIGVQSVRVFSAEMVPVPGQVRVGSVVDIRARVESIGPGGYRVTECLSGGPCPAILMVPSAETQARLNAAELNNAPADIHGTISAFQPGGTPVISVSSVQTQVATATEGILPRFAACLGNCLRDHAGVVLAPATIALHLTACGAVSLVGSLLFSPLSIPENVLLCLASVLGVDASVLALCIPECVQSVGRG